MAVYRGSWDVFRWACSCVFPATAWLCVHVSLKDGWGDGVRCSGRQTPTAALSNFWQVQCVRLWGLFRHDLIQNKNRQKKKLSAHWIYNIFAWMTACCILGLSLRLLPCSLPSTSSRIKHFLYLPTMIQWANIFIIPHESLKDCFLRKKVAEFVCSLYIASLTQLWWVYERAQWKTRRLWLVLDAQPPWLSDRGSTGCTHQDSARSGTTKDTDENGGPEFSGLHQIPSTL